MTAPSSTWFTASPEWGWLIVFYFFFGGLAGGCFFIAALIDLFGRPEDRPLARTGYYTVLPCLLVSGVLLILDLSRPDRFWHLLLQANTFLPMFKSWSPMSLGSWALAAFGAFALAAFLAALAEADRLRWRWPLHLRPPGMLGAIVAVVGALLGLYVAGYTGVLLAVTNRPLWSDTPLLGALLVVSATSISAAYLFLLGRRAASTPHAVFALNRMDRWVILLELLVLIALVASLGRAATVWWSGWGALLLIGVVVLGLVLPLMLHRRDAGVVSGSSAIAAALVLIGGFILRTVIVFTPEGIGL